MLSGIQDILSIDYSWVPGIKLARQLKTGQAKFMSSVWSSTYKTSMNISRGSSIVMLWMLMPRDMPVSQAMFSGQSSGLTKSTHMCGAKKYDTKFMST